MKIIVELFEHTLHDIYCADNALAKALQAVSKAITDSKFKQAFEAHLEKTKGHVQTLKKMFL